MTATDIGKAAEATAVVATLARPTSLWRDAARRLRRNRGALAGLIILAVLAVIAVVAPLISPYDPLAISPTAPLKGPSAAHLFGTDQFGRDIFSRILSGTRLSFEVGFIAVGLSMIFGVFLGLIAGYYGKTVDTVISILIDIMLAFPGILLALAIIAILGPSLLNLMIAVGIGGIPTYTRLVRGATLSVKQQTYIEAAHVSGATDSAILFRHILPNVLAPVIVLATLGIGTAILVGASLSFLGLGAKPPAPEWGAMLSAGRNYLTIAWWITLFPGLAIMITVLSINMVGDGLRDALDPRLKR